MPAKAKKRCPECGASVRIDKLEDHMKKVHPKADRKGILTEEEKVEVEMKKKVVDRRPMSKKEMSFYLIGLIIIIVVVLIAVFNKPGETSLIGKDAPDFTVTDTDSSTFHLKSEIGRVVLLSLMDAKCSHCQMDTKNTLVPLYAKYNSRVMFISVDVQILGADTDAALLSFKSSTGATWRFCLDTDGVQSKYNVGQTPTDCIIDTSGKVFSYHLGESNYNEMVSTLEKALNG